MQAENGEEEKRRVTNLLESYGSRNNLNIFNIVEQKDQLFKESEKIFRKFLKTQLKLGKEERNDIFFLNAPVVLENLASLIQTDTAHRKIYVSQGQNLSKSVKPLVERKRTNKQLFISVSSHQQFIGGSIIRCLVAFIGAYMAIYARKIRRDVHKMRPKSNANRLPIYLYMLQKVSSRDPIFPV